MSETRTERTRLELDGVVVGVELTLLAIIQGVVLYFLAEASVEPVVALEYQAWPYIVAGLVMVLLFWSRAMIHTFTVIRWPIEYGHNFLYVACALVQALMLGRIARPQAYFALGSLLCAFVWALFVYDLRLIRSRMSEESGPAGRQLFALLLEEQGRNIRVAMPLATAFHVLAAAAVWLWPGALLEHEGHLALVALQLIGTVAYQAYTLRWWTRIAPLLLRCRDEWRRSAGD